MNVCVASEALGAITESKKFPRQYHVTLAISVDDVAALWAAAAEICVRDAGLSADEVDETIGPREDPSIEDCLTILALPTRLAGCEVVDFSLKIANDALNATAIHANDQQPASLACCPERAASLRQAAGGA